MERKLLAMIVSIFTLGGSGFVAKSLVESKAEAEIQKRLDKMVNAASGFADISYSCVKVNLLREELLISDIRVKSTFFEGDWLVKGIRISHIDRTFLKKAVFNQLDPEKDAPLGLRVEVIGIEVPLERLSPQAFESFSKIGYQHLRFNLMSDYRLDKEAETLALNSSIQMHGGGEVKFSVSFGSVEYDNLIKGLARFHESKDFSALAPATFITLSGFEFGYVDQSLISRLNWLFYQKHKSTLATAFKEMQARRQEMLQQEMMVMNASAFNREPSSTGPGQLAQQATSAMQTFLESPKSISLVARPEKPVPLMKIIQLAPQGEEAILQTFGISVVANGG